MILLIYTIIMIFVMLCVTVCINKFIPGQHPSKGWLGYKSSSFEDATRKAKIANRWFLALSAIWVIVFFYTLPI